MLKNRTFHAEYQQFIISILSSFYKIFPKKVEELEPSISKLYCLDLDIFGEILKPYYSNTGRTATFQPEIFRSFSLMLFQKETSITNFVMMNYLQHASVALAVKRLHLVLITILSPDCGYLIYHLIETNLKSYALIRKNLLKQKQLVDLIYV